MFCLWHGTFIDINIWHKTSIPWRISCDLCSPHRHIINNVCLPPRLILNNLIRQRIMPKCAHGWMVLSCPTPSFRNIGFFGVWPEWSLSLLNLFCLCLRSLVILLVICLIKVFGCAFAPSGWFEPCALSSFCGSIWSLGFSGREK